MIYGEHDPGLAILLTEGEPPTEPLLPVWLEFLIASGALALMALLML
ncbi:hypothetical protein [Paenirhodobacter sp.]